LGILRADVYGSPNIGVYCHSNETTAIVPPGMTKKKADNIRQYLGVRLCLTNIGGCALLGVLVVSNSNGIVFPHIIHDHELNAIRESLEVKVAVAQERWTALGNLVLANDNGAIIHPGASESLAKRVAETLNVDIATATIGGLPYVGSLAVATNKGVLTYDAITDRERAIIEKTLKVPVETGTINGGVRYIRAGLLANTKGAVVGPLTSGPELMAITRTLGIDQRR
jgi:translation initiation factor 6